MKEKDYILENRKKSFYLKSGLDTVTLGLPILMPFLHLTGFPFLVSVPLLLGSNLYFTKQIRTKMDDTSYLLRQKDMQELLELYCTYLKDAKAVFDAFSITHPLDVTGYFEMSLWNGYFSKEGVFHYNNHQFKHNHFLLEGSRVMSGLGCCRHISSLFLNFTESYPFKTGWLGGYLGEELDTSKQQANHAISLLEVNGKKMARDITNHQTYLFTSSKELKGIEDSSIFFIKGNQATDIDKFLALPSLNMDDYMTTCNERNQQFREEQFLSVMKNMKQLNQKSQSQLERICQIEEKYTMPDIRKAKKIIK